MEKEKTGFTNPKQGDLEYEGKDNVKRLPVDRNFRGRLKLGRGCQSDLGKVADEPW